MSNKDLQTELVYRELITWEKVATAYKDGKINQDFITNQIFNLQTVLKIMGVEKD
jgi:hypothetical protein